MMFIYYTLISNVLFFFFILMILIGVAYLTLLERKILGYIQDRLGPNKVSMVGILQPIGDAMKLLTKELVVLVMVDYLYYWFMPILMMFLMMMILVVIPFKTNLFMTKYSILFMILIMSMNVFPLMILGWSSKSNYSMMGSLRCIAQLISYEVSFMMILISMMLMIESYELFYSNKFQEYLWYIFYLYVIFYMLFISILAEMNRTPFDFIEGESELVSGFNVEFWGSLFSMIFLTEYMGIIFMSLLIIYLFMSMNYMYLYSVFLVWLIIFIRGVLPRMRYDKLMDMCWKKILPLSLVVYMYVMGFKLLMLF